jgi:hypothetical protein
MPLHFAIVSDDTTGGAILGGLGEVGIGVGRDGLAGFQLEHQLRPGLRGERGFCVFWFADLRRSLGSNTNTYSTRPNPGCGARSCPRNVLGLLR